MKGLRRTPFYFGPGDRRLFGWLHLPAAGPSRSIGVVICNPIGSEYIRAFRTLRRYADEFARAGFPTLRFDYDGTGDSAGSDTDPQRIAMWVASIAEAIETLKRVSGVERVALLGLRLGCLLAVQAAKERTDVIALACHAPVASTKAYLRELRVLRLAMGQAAGSENITVETAGFLFTAEAQSDLLKLDYALAGNPLDILLIERDDFPANDRLFQTFLSTGHRVEQLRGTGYAAMMSDPHDSVIPGQCIQTCVDWLDRIAPEEPPAQSQLAPQSLQGLAVIKDGRSNALTETTIFAGANARCFGILTLPPNIPAQPISVVLVNAGAVHHVGPNRLHVELARAWAAQGATVVRIDLAGIGDSDPQPGQEENVVYPEGALADIESVLAQLPQRGSPRDAVLIGLCSGAYHSLKAALAIPARSIILINPLTFFYSPNQALDYADHRVSIDVNRYRHSAFQLSSWLKVFRGRVNLLTVAAVISRRMLLRAESLWADAARLLGVTLRNDLASELSRLAAQNTQMHFIFAAADPGNDLLKLQGGRIVTKLQQAGELSLSVIEDADHTFTDIRARRELARRLTRLIGLDDAGITL